jgi:hypothetical protein
VVWGRNGFCLLMSKTFRPWTIDQPLLLPPSVRDFVGEDHLARFVVTLVLDGARIAAMRAKIKAGGHASPYRLRKQLPEPVFGQIKQARGFRQFLLRGVEKVAAEWSLVCLAHNILKLAQGRTPSPAALAAG